MTKLDLTLALAYVGSAAIIAVLGRRRSMGAWGFFFGSLVLTPVIGLLLLLVSGPAKRTP